MNDKAKIDKVILAQCTSTSGKWTLYLCEHIVSGRFCYDVMARSAITGIGVSRHYRNQIDDSINKAEALRIFDEYREKLTAPASSQEGDDEAKMIILEPN